MFGVPWRLNRIFFVAFALSFVFDDPRLRYFEWLYELSKSFILLLPIIILHEAYLVFNDGSVDDLDNRYTLLLCIVFVLWIQVPSSTQLHHQKLVTFIHSTFHARSDALLCRGFQLPVTAASSHRRVLSDFRPEAIPATFVKDFFIDISNESPSHPPCLCALSQRYAP
jgi:hypothetical protein